MRRDATLCTREPAVGRPGRSTITGVPAGERVSLRVSVRGYRMPASNASLDLTNRASIEGKVDGDGDVDGLVVLLEPDRAFDIDEMAQICERSQEALAA